MSPEEAKDRLDQAIRDLVASDPDNAGHLVSHWVLIYASVNETGDAFQGYEFSADTVPNYVAKGLLVETLDQVRRDDTNAG